jgi:hypothetical protein
MTALRNLRRRPAPLLAVGLVALAGAVASPAPARSTGGHLRAVSRSASAISLAAAGYARAASLQGRYRSAASRRWRVSALGRHRRWRVGGLRVGTTYLFEVRVCRGAGAHRRCGHWSAAVHASTTGSSPAPSGAGTGTGPGTGGSGGQTDGTVTCAVFPPDNAINQDISSAAVDPNSDRYIASIGASGHLHPDFGSPADYGIPYTVVGPDQPKVPINFTAYGDESDPGPYPVPPDAPVESAGAAGDRHVLVVQNGTCKLYEMFDAAKTASGWDAGSGAVFDLRSNALRPDGWTSADAAGLPIFPLLARYDEVAAGSINHALRFTVARTQRGYIHPATHYASSSTDSSLPPMGLRLRLKASFDTSGYSGPALVILQALKRYGMIVADNGSNWFITGTSDPRWNDSQLDQLKNVPGSAFEVVQTGAIQH